MKFFKLISIVIISLLIMGCYMDDGLSKPTHTVFAFIKRYGQPLAKKHGLSLGAIGGGENNGFWLMNLLFTRKGNPVNISEARKMIIPLAEQFLLEVNANEEIKLYLRDYPFSVNNLDLAIIYYDSKGYETFSPWIASVSIVKGKLIYFIDNPEMADGFNCVLKETYEEALEKLKQEKMQIDKQSIE